VIALDPFDAVLGDGLLAAFAGRDVDALALAVENLRPVLLRVDLDFVVVGRLLLAYLGDDLDRLAGRQKAI